MFLIEKNFESLLSTIVLFIEQEPFSNVPMNLDVNFWHIHQENFTHGEGLTFKDSIFTEKGDTFQNSPMHLFFYEKINITKPNDDLVPTLDELPKSSELPELSSMSYIRLKGEIALDFDGLDPDDELLLVLQGVTAQFVTKERYQQLLFVLGQKTFSSVGNQKKFDAVLTLFNSFHTSDVQNFKDMLNGLQFPFVYNNQKTLAEN